MNQRDIEEIEVAFERAEGTGHIGERHGLYLKIIARCLFDLCKRPLDLDAVAKLRFVKS